MKEGESREGAYGTPKSRDYQQYYYADDISTPRNGPNPRAVSNAFFKRKQTLYYEHTPLLLGLIEFIMHDISWSSPSRNDVINVAMPEDEEVFQLNATLRVLRTEAASGTGSSKANRRESLNRATTWLDASPLYGSTEDVARKLRSFSGGKLLTQNVSSSKIGNMEYLPFNSMDVPTNSPPDIPTNSLFAGGDPRTNQDWVLLAVHTLLLREHNRLCDLITAQRSNYDDETLYQTARLLIGAKLQLIANAYQMAYFDNMTWPADDGFPLYREITGRNWLDINPANSYPWPIASTGGKPTTASAEMATVYRFHEFIIENFPIKDSANKTLWEQNLFDTGFNAIGFMNTGLDNILRGMTSTYIPNFKSGVEESYRSAMLYNGQALDIVVASIVREREQGLPTFNEYFRAYNRAGQHLIQTIFHMLTYSRTQGQGTNSRTIRGFHLQSDCSARP